MPEKISKEMEHAVLKVSITLQPMCIKNSKTNISSEHGWTQFDKQDGEDLPGSQRKTPVRVSMLY